MCYKAFYFCISPIKIKAKKGKPSCQLESMALNTKGYNHLIASATPSSLSVKGRHRSCKEAIRELQGHVAITTCSPICSKSINKLIILWKSSCPFNFSSWNPHLNGEWKKEEKENSICSLNRIENSDYFCHPHSQPTSIPLKIERNFYSLTK